MPPSTRKPQNRSPHRTRHCSIIDSVKRLVHQGMIVCNGPNTFLLPFQESDRRFEPFHRKSVPDCFAMQCEMHRRYDPHAEMNPGCFGVRLFTTTVHSLPSDGVFKPYSLEANSSSIYSSICDTSPPFGVPSARQIGSDKLSDKNRTDPSASPI